MATYTLGKQGWLLKDAAGNVVIEGTKGEVMKEASRLMVDGHTVKGLKVEDK